MKKLTLLLFVAGLFVISFTNTNCKRPNPGITPISNGDTQKTSTKIDSSGEDVHVTVYQNGSIVTGAQVAGGAEVYLFNNYNDGIAYQNNGNLKSKYIDSAATNGSGQCSFHIPAKNCTGRYFPSSAGSYAGAPYNYYCAAKWKDSEHNNRVNTGWYSNDGNCKDPASFTVSINNGLNNQGYILPLAVLYP